VIHYDRSIKASTAIITQYGTGGSLLYLKELVRAMKDRGYAVLFYLPVKTDVGIEDDPLFRFDLKEPSIPPALIKVKVFKYLFHLSKYLYNSFTISPDDDIEVAHLLFPYYLTDLISVTRLKKKGMKVVLTVHEVYPHNPLLGGRIDRVLAAKMYEKADMLLVHSNSLKEELMSIFTVSPRKIHVVPHGYFSIPQSLANEDELRRRYGLPTDRKVLLFFGTIRENKGLDVLLNAMKMMRDDYLLLIAGCVSDASELPAGHYRRIIRDSNIGGSVRWIDRFIDEEEIADVFKVADAVILPYKKSFHAQSGVLNTAIGFEKPAVVSDVGGMGETVRDYRIGVVVRPEDAGALREGVSALFKDRQEFGFERYKRENSWHVVADKLVSIYNGLRFE
jgi:glycosyltransferase involved in cell wall biosynthesis